MQGSEIGSAARSLPWLLCVLAAAAGPARGGEAALPEAVRGGLEAAARGINPLTLTWRQQATSDSPRAVFEYMDWPDNKEFYLPIRVHYSWQDGKFYALYNHRRAAEAKVVRGQDMNEFEREYAFNGTTYYAGEGVEGTKRRGLVGTLSVMSLQNILAKKVTNLGPNSVLQLYPGLYYRALGFRLPLSASEFAADVRQDSLVLWLLRSGATLAAVRDETLEGRRVVYVELKGSDRLAANFPGGWNHVDRRDCLLRFYLDPARGYAACRHEERTGDGRLATLYEGDDWFAVAGTGLWLPRRLRVTHYGYFDAKRRPREQPLFADEYALETSDTARIPDSTFTISYDNAPSMMVQTDSPADRKPRPDQIAYVVPPSTQMLDKVIDEAIQKSSSRPHALNRPLILGSGLALALAAVGLWLWRRNRERTGAGARRP
jgi:hypothetical protein